MQCIVVVVVVLRPSPFIELALDLHFFVLIQLKQCYQILKIRFQIFIKSFLALIVSSTTIPCLTFVLGAKQVPTIFDHAKWQKALWFFARGGARIEGVFKKIHTYFLLCRSIKIGYSVNYENPIDTNFNNRLYFSTFFLYLYKAIRNVMNFLFLCYQVKIILRLISLLHKYRLLM